MNESQAAYLRATGTDDDREALRDAAIHLRRSGLDEMADKLEGALVEYDGARSEARRFLDEREREHARLADAEDRATMHQQLAAKLLADDSRYTIVDRETGEPLAGDALRDLIDGREPAPEPEQRPQTLLGGGRLE